MEIKGKVSLITGGSKGIGFAIAESLVKSGSNVFICARDKSELRRAVGDLRRFGNAEGEVCDVRSEEQVRMMLEECERVFGGVDILINNAGVASYGNPATMNFDDAFREMNVNYFGALRMSRALAPQMIERGSGMIVNIATAFAKINLPLVGTYCASKAAMLSLGQALRAYLKDKGVHVMTVMPTTIDTDMAKGADVPKMTPEFVAG